MSRRGEESKSEVIVSENVVPDLYAFIQNARFTQTIEEFCGKYAREFESLFEEKSPELSHEHKLIFDDYQNLLEKLFSEFADKHSLSVNDIFECCRDVGKSLGIVHLVPLTFFIYCI